MVYLDWAAGAPPDRAPHDFATTVTFDRFANPSARHTEGRRAAEAIQEARLRVASALGVPAREVYFTSGATEANNIVLSSFILRPGRGSVVTTAFEHASVHEPGMLLERLGYEVRRVGTDRSGIVDPDEIAYRVDRTTVAVAVLHVANETGAIQPIAEIERAVRAKQPSGRKAHLHVDLAQTVGKTAFDFTSTRFDSASFSGYKFGAPHGAGVLLLRKPLETVYRGGGQEGGVRAGTENLFAIAGLAEAIRPAIREGAARSAETTAMKRRLFEACRAIPSAVVVPGELSLDPARYAPSILSVSFPPVPAEVTVRTMGEHGFLISAGSACSSKKRDDTRVLQAVGYTRAEARSTVRVSWGTGTDPAELERFGEALAAVVPRITGSLR